MTTYYKRKGFARTDQGLIEVKRNVTVRNGVATIRYHGERQEVMCFGTADNPCTSWSSKAFVNWIKQA